MSEHSIAGKKVAFLLTDGVEQVELTSPWQAVKDAGGEPTLVASDAQQRDTTLLVVPACLQAFLEFNDVVRRGERAYRDSPGSNPQLTAAM